MEQRPNTNGGVSGSAYIITGVGLAFTAIVVLFIWIKFFRRRTMQRLMLEIEAARIAGQAAQRAPMDDECERPPSPKRPVAIKDAVMIEHPDGSTGFAYNTDDSDEDGSIDGDAAMRAKLRDAATCDPIPGSTELSAVVVIGDREPRAATEEPADNATVTEARENTFEWVGTGPRLPLPPHLLEQEAPEAQTPPRRRWYHRALGLRAEEPVASSARPVMTSTVLGAHDAAAHPMALAFSFGG